MRLTEDQLLPAGTACPFCASRDRRKVYRLQEKPDIHLLSCNNCHAASASRMPAQDTLSEYYKSYFSGKKEKVTFDRPERMAAHIFRAAKDCPAGSVLNILDFGGGDGRISIQLAKKFIGKGVDAVNIVLVDYNPHMAAPDDKRIAMEHFSHLSGIGTRKFEIVIASAIIEHVPSPAPDLIRLLNALQKGGVFYARTPYLLPFLRIFRSFGMTLDFKYPGHVHDLGPDFWNGIVGKLPLEGTFEVLKSKPSIAETTFRQHFFQTVRAHALKSPWYLFKKRYRLVGGWEVFIRKS